MITTLLGSIEIKVATYNVENLFDLNLDGGEYAEYRPNSSWQWNKENYRKKLKNISKVISDLNPDIIALQEIESATALKDLKDELSRSGCYYKYSAITSKNTTVKVAVLSKFPIMYSKDVSVTSNRRYRDILESKIDINGNALYIFVNHWKAKSGPESRRIVSAKALRKRLDELGDEKDIVLVGDFNSHYEENISFIKSRKHNDTDGVTGINDILKTSPSYQKESHSYYNLWYEIKDEERWTHKFKGKKEAIDSILISKGLMDSKNIEYMRGSFNKFNPKYLFYRNSIYRWQQSRTFPKHHIGKGYSDHLPIYAKFSIAKQ